MDNRQKQLDELRNYLKKTDSEITMVLQNLQWDRKHLFKDEDMQICKYNSNHRIPRAKIETHEEECYLKFYGYLKQDLLLPDPFDNNSRTLVKLSHEDIKRIIFNVSNSNSQLKKVWEIIIQLLMPMSLGIEDEKIEPLSLEKLQYKYTVEERRTIYDSVVAHTPSQSDISELELPSVQQAKQKPKTKLEVLAELRDMKRRRAKYRVATKSKNYSEVLREVIKNQMEWYAEIQGGVADISNPEILNFKSEKEDWKQCDERDTLNCQTSYRKPSSDFKHREPDEYNNSVFKKKESHRNNYNSPSCSISKSSSQSDLKKYQFKRHKERRNDYEHYKVIKNDRGKHKHHDSKHEHYHRDRDYKGRNDCEEKGNREY